MIRSPNNIEVRKRKWKTVLFLLRKRKRKIYDHHDVDYERNENPSNDVGWEIEGSGMENPRNDEGFGTVNPRLGLINDNDERGEKARNDVDWEIEGSGMENPRSGLDNDNNDDEDDDERDENLRNDVEWELEGSGTVNTRLGLDNVVAGEEVKEKEKEVEESLKSAVMVVSERKDGGDMPPEDDICPICFDSFSIACKTNCGHWFCANCILQFWTYRTVLQKCNCPICARSISKLTPEASLLMMQEVEVVEVLKNVQRYNRLFQGGINGVIRKVFEVPNVFKRMLYGLMDPDRFRGNYYAMRSFALLMSCIYNIGSFEFIPTGMLGVRRLFDLCAIALVVILCLVGICHRLVLRQRVRRLAANQL